MQLYVKDFLASESHGLHLFAYHVFIKCNVYSNTVTIADDVNINNIDT